MTGAPGESRQRWGHVLAFRSPGWTTGFFWFYLGLAALSALPVFLITRSLTAEVEHSRFVAAAEQAAYRLAHEIDLTLANLRALKGSMTAPYMSPGRSSQLLFDRSARGRRCNRSNGYHGCP